MYKSINGNLCIPTNQLIPNYPNLRRGYYKQLLTITDSSVLLFLNYQAMEFPPLVPIFVIYSIK